MMDFFMFVLETQTPLLIWDYLIINTKKLYSLTNIVRAVQS